MNSALKIGVALGTIGLTAAGAASPAFARGGHGFHHNGGAFAGHRGAGFRHGWGRSGGGYAWNHNRGGYYGGGYYGGGYVDGGLGLGLAAGVIGGALLASQAPYYGYDAAAPGYDAQSAEAYCASRFKSYNPATGTYLGYDGLRHSCP